MVGSRRAMLIGMAALLVACTPAAPPAAPTTAPAAKAAAPANSPAAASPATAASPSTAASAAASPASSPVAKPAAAAPAASKAAPSGPAANEPAEWVVALGEEAANLDPNTGQTSNGNAQIQQNIFNALYYFVALREGPGFTAVPALAESYKIVDDTTWEFALRKGVKFHNGDDFTAEDVKYSFDEYTKESSPRPEMKPAIAGVDVVNTHTVRIRTKGPQAALLSIVSFANILPMKAREAAGVEAFNTRPIGTGPYKLVEWTRGNRIVLEANADYFEGKVSPQKLTIRYIPDPTTRVAELKTGGVHILQSPALAQFGDIKSDANATLLPLNGGRAMHNLFVTAKKPFDDPRVRQAVMYAINKDAIIKSVLEGYGEPLHGPFSSGWIGYDPNLAPFPYDPAKAKQLLAEAGYPNGVDTVYHMTSGVYLRDREVAEVIAAQLAEVGIRMRLQTGEVAKILTDWRAGALEGVLIHAWGTSADPENAITTEYYKRTGHAPDAELTALIERSRSTVDPAERLKALQQLGKYLQDQAYCMCIYSQDEFWAKRNTINWEAYPYGGSYSRVQLYRLDKR